jgi:hypothetical protein
MVENGRAHVEDQALADARRVPALGERERRVEYRQRGDDQRETHHHGGRAVRGDRVDDVPGQDGSGHPDDGVEDDQDEEDGEVCTVRTGEAGHSAPGSGRQLGLNHGTV